MNSKNHFFELFSKCFSLKFSPWKSLYFKLTHAETGVVVSISNVKTNIYIIFQYIFLSFLIISSSVFPSIYLRIFMFQQLFENSRSIQQFAAIKKHFLFFYQMSLECNAIWLAHFFTQIKIMQGGTDKLLSWMKSGWGVGVALHGSNHKYIIVIFLVLIKGY